MGNHVDVYVLDSEGTPVSSTLVTMVIPGIGKGGTLKAFTDRDGHAEFDTGAYFEASPKFTVYVGRESFGPYYFDASALTVQIP